MPALCAEISYKAQYHLSGRRSTDPLTASTTSFGSIELRRSAVAIVKARGMSVRISKELRFGGNAAIMPRWPSRVRAVRMAGQRSLSAEMINAMSDALLAVSATRETAMFTSVSFSS